MLHLALQIFNSFGFEVGLLSVQDASAWLQVFHNGGPEVSLTRSFLSVNPSSEGLAHVLTCQRMLCFNVNPSLKHHLTILCLPWLSLLLSLSSQQKP
jgi:hypothetical protein